MTQPSNVDKLVSIDVAQRFEVLQEEVDLLKHEVKQTLVDLRGFIMEGRTILPQISNGARLASPPKLPDVSNLETSLAESPPVMPVPQPKLAPNRLPRKAEQDDRAFEVSDGLNTGMFGELINWLATVKRFGLSLPQITPYVEAYEKAGYLSPLIVKVILLSMADLDQRVEAPADNNLPPGQYLECLRAFHDIICTHPSSPGPSWATPETEHAEMTARPATPISNGNIPPPLPTGQGSAGWEPAEEQIANGTSAIGDSDG